MIKVLLYFIPIVILFSVFNLNSDASINKPSFSKKHSTSKHINNKVKNATNILLADSIVYSNNYLNNKFGYILGEDHLRSSNYKDLVFSDKKCVQAIKDKKLNTVERSVLDSEKLEEYLNVPITKLQNGKIDFKQFDNGSKDLKQLTKSATLSILKNDGYIIDGEVPIEFAVVVAMACNSMNEPQNQFYLPLPPNMPKGVDRAYLAKDLATNRFAAYLGKGTKGKPEFLRFKTLSTTEGKGTKMPVMYKNGFDASIAIEVNEKGAITNPPVLHIYVNGTNPKKISEIIDATGALLTGKLPHRHCERLTNFLSFYFANANSPIVPYLSKNTKIICSGHSFGGTDNPIRYAFFNQLHKQNPGLFSLKDLQFFSADPANIAQSCEAASKILAEKNNSNIEEEYQKLTNQITMVMPLPHSGASRINALLENRKSLKTNWLQKDGSLNVPYDEYVGKQVGKSITHFIVVDSTILNAGYDLQQFPRLFADEEYTLERSKGFKELKRKFIILKRVHLLSNLFKTLGNNKIIFISQKNKQNNLIPTTKENVRFKKKMDKSFQKFKRAFIQNFNKSFKPYNASVEYYIKKGEILPPLPY